MPATIGTTTVSGDNPKAEARIPIALVDDHVMVRQGFASWLLAGTGDVEVVGSASTVAELLAVTTTSPRVVLLDVSLGDDSTMTGNIATLRAAGCEVVMVSQFVDAETVDMALHAGARGYLNKQAEADELLLAIRAADRAELHLTQLLAGAMMTDPQGRGDPPPVVRPQLSPQEVRVVRLYAAGMLQSSVAARLGLAEGTVKTYVDRIRRKYEQAGRDARSRIALYCRAEEDGYLED